MVANEESLYGIFEYTGLWFRPEFPNRQIHGTLKYSKGDITLTTTGSLENLDDNIVTQLQHIDQIPRQI
ncbi:MAG: hypothetical protein ACRDFB_07320, partial [Rhabdochlamydiaceae bacterium]